METQGTPRPKQSRERGNRQKVSLHHETGVYLPPSIPQPPIPLRLPTPARPVAYENHQAVHRESRRSDETPSYQPKPLVPDDSHTHPIKNVISHRHRCRRRRRGFPCTSSSRRSMTTTTTTISTSIIAIVTLSLHSIHPNPSITTRTHTTTPHHHEKQHTSGNLC